MNHVVKMSKFVTVRAAIRLKITLLLSFGELKLEMAFLSLQSQQWWQEPHGLKQFALFLFSLLLPFLLFKLR